MAICAFQFLCFASVIEFTVLYTGENVLLQLCSMLDIQSHLSHQANCIRISLLPLQLQKIQIYSTDSQLWIPIVQSVFLCHKYDDKTNFDTF